ncbi:hypothetical protein J6590_009782 [Homalodisca vitripennis]|nr:hypothetical protein J6590_009782 [Homalodisca vitripennis]
MSKEENLQSGDKKNNVVFHGEKGKAWNLKMKEHCRSRLCRVVDLSGVKNRGRLEEVSGRKCVAWGTWERYGCLGPERKILEHVLCACCESVTDQTPDTATADIDLQPRSDAA